MIVLGHLTEAQRRAYRIADNKLTELGSWDEALLSAELQHPAGYGRILHHADGSICGIVEEKDATPKQRAIQEINTGFLAAPAVRLRGWLD